MNLYLVQAVSSDGENRDLFIQVSKADLQTLPLFEIIKNIFLEHYDLEDEDYEDHEIKIFKIPLPNNLSGQTRALSWHEPGGIEQIAL